jgi:hypothetical protein
LTEWLIEQEVEEAVMESTAQYWKPVWEALERYWQPTPECGQNSRVFSVTVAIRRLHALTVREFRGLLGRMHGRGAAVRRFAQS